MGAHQSSPEQGPNAATAKACYYELLGVERDAADLDIKKAYRRRALELHPDRNLGDVETATRRFAEVQAAYDVLSDPQERAWYDSHRDAILSGQEHPGAGDEPTIFRNIRLTTTDEVLGLMRKFTASVPFDDEPLGFFTIVRGTFEQLALEEAAAAESQNTDCPEYPSFGASNADYDSVVKPFYSAWAAFSTKKSFSWTDKYRLSDAPDRRVRRLMDKENKKGRDDALREFNDAVRFLVSFVRKRDPRYLPNVQTDAQRQKLLRDAAAAQAARSRAANLEKLAASYHLPDWAGSRDDGDADEELFSDAADEMEIQVLECIVCGKTFKSANQLEAHERSKKHIRTLQRLRRHMQEEGADLGLEISVSPKSARIAVSSAAEETIDGAELDAAAAGGQEPTGPQESATVSDSDDYAPRSAVEERLAASSDPSDVGDVDDGMSNPARNMAAGDDTTTRPKVGKAKAKRQKKAATLGSTAGDDAGACSTYHQCSVCAESFTSRTKLFKHIRSEDHAAALPGTSAADGKARRKRKK